MDLTRLTNKRGYFFDGFNLLLGYIGGEGSPYFKFLSAKVIYSKPLFFNRRRTWNHGYKHNNWDWNHFEFISPKAFGNLDDYLSFIDGATIDEIKAYLKLKDLMETKDFKECKINL